jgi:hypothetical protein
MVAAPVWLTPSYAVSAGAKNAFSAIQLEV